jgi:hypothetical protein
MTSMLKRIIFVSALLAALLVAASASTPQVSTFLRTLKDKTCPDGKQHCLSDEPCCAFTPGEYGCCSSDESCCADDVGAACCIVQPTYCVPKNANLNPYPARCCPRYTVGCNVGEVGCCDPAIPWQRGAPLHPQSKYKNVAKKTGRKADATKYWKSKSTVAADKVAYALVTNGIAPGLVAWTIDLTCGNITQKIPVEGYNTHGEATRDFLYDSATNLFYQFDVDFQAKKAANGRQIVLSKIDPTNGKTTKVNVTGGARDYVTGFCIEKSSKKSVLISSKSEDGNNFNFYSVDIATGVSTEKGSVPIPSGKEEDPGHYAGYFRNCDSKSVTRIGYESVVNQENPGLGLVTFADSSNAAASSKWNGNVPVPDGFNFYLGAKQFQDSFLSLAPNITTGLLSLVQWTGNKANVLLDTQCGPPRVMGAGELGFVLDAVRESDSTYVALVDDESPIPIPEPGIWDQWALAVVDLKSKTMKMLTLTPEILEGETAISGIGLPDL